LLVHEPREEKREYEGMRKRERGREKKSDHKNKRERRQDDEQKHTHHSNWGQIILYMSSRKIHPHRHLISFIHFYF
jgi:hypothetical protein